jgi:hypothetical protein
VQLAATASRTAGASSRLEIYPKSLPLVRALRITQAGLVRWKHNVPEHQQQMLTVDDVRERVLSRFPDLEAMFERPALDDQLAEAGFALKWIRDERHRDLGYIADVPESVSSAASLGSRVRTLRGAQIALLTDPILQAANTTEQRLRAAAERPGFRVLTVRTTAYLRARSELTHRFGAQPVPVASLFVAKMKERIALGTRPTWTTILNADIAEPGSRAATKLLEYTSAAWRDAESELAALLSPSSTDHGADGPVLLYDAGLFTRYGALSVLQRLANTARRGGGRPLWVLCPAADAGDGPKLDGALVRTEMDSEWVELTKEWVENRHRGGVVTVSGGEGVRA